MLSWTFESGSILYFPINLSRTNLRWLEALDLWNDVEENHLRLGCIFHLCTRYRKTCQVLPLYYIQCLLHGLMCSSSICDWATLVKLAFCYQTLVQIRKPDDQISVVSLNFFLHGKHDLKKISFWIASFFSVGIFQKSSAERLNQCS